MSVDMYSVPDAFLRTQKSPMASPVWNLVLVPSITGVRVVGLPPGCAGAWKPLAVARTVRGVPSAAELLFLAFLSMSASSVQPPQIERTAPRKRAMKECLLIYLMIVRL